jgi:DNA polymerase III delta prime subunit
MGMLSRVTTGKISRPHLVLIYGPDGIGKTTFGANAPKPVFLGAEQGTNFLDVARFPTPKNWGEVVDAIKELTTENHDYKTLVIDSLDWLEPMLFEQICKEHGAKSIELAAGGYGKGYTEAVERWIAFMKAINQLRETKGMNIILIAHSDTKTFNDAQLQITYERYQLKLHKNASPKFKEWVDSVLFCNYEVYTKKEGSAVQAFGEGERKMWTEGRPGYDAKNRMGLPNCLPLSWEAYETAYKKAIEGGEKPEHVINRIEDLLKNDAATDELRTKVVETVTKHATNLKQLQFIEQKLKERLNAVVEA